jgi:tetratricopeptide (TPR) repeat protein/predicted Ser/Thr protein kinase
MTTHDEPGSSEHRASTPPSQRWPEIRLLVEAVLTKPRTARSRFLDDACNGDAWLRSEVEAQADACELAAGSNVFLSGPAAAFVSPLFSGDTFAEHIAERVTDTGAITGTITGAQTSQSPEIATALRSALTRQYDVVRELGRGGMATVYLAYDRRHERSVALKVLDPTLGAAMSTERFLSEIRVTAQLTHPHILPLYDSGEVAGVLYYVMPYVEGENLRERLAREGPLALEDARRLVREIASALAYAHRHGVVHRDIKPANILFEDGHAIVADFGVARAIRRAGEPKELDAASGQNGTMRNSLTQTGTTPGTPAYMAPEQTRTGAIADHRADIYALGVVAYEVLAGVHPFGVRAPRDMIAAHCSETPASIDTVRAGVPPALASFVMCALAKDPAARPQSAEEIVTTLDSVRLSGTERLANAEPSHRFAKWRRRRVVAAALIVTLAAGAALAIGIRARRDAAPGNSSAVDARKMAAKSATAMKRGTADQEAYDLYLEGRYFWLQRGAENLARSISYYQQALARDPTFARADAGLAMAYSTLPDYVPDPTDSAIALTEAHARRAIALDSTLADAQLALGIALDMRLRFKDAQARYRTALAIDPSSVTGHHWLGMSLLNLGHTDEALVELRHAMDLDPLATMPTTAFSTALVYARRFPEARIAARRALALDSTFIMAIWTLGLAQTFGGQPDSAVLTLERGLRLHPDDSRLSSGLVLAYASAGRWSDAAKIRAQLHRPGADRSGWADAALADLAFGDREPFVRVLTTEVGQRRYEAAGALLGCNPVLDPLWSDARFRAAMRRLMVTPCPVARSWPFLP